MQLHIELFTVMYGQRRCQMRGLFPQHVPVDAQRVLEVWDYEGNLSEHERTLINGALRREVCREYQALRGDGRPLPLWEEAFAQVGSCGCRVHTGQSAVAAMVLGRSGKRRHVVAVWSVMQCNEAPVQQLAVWVSLPNRCVWYGRRRGRAFVRLPSMAQRGDCWATASHRGE
eukprot:365535-Chlamydomonas_euryale.AAC.89